MMTDMELRLACLHLVDTKSLRKDLAIEKAEALVNYVKNGLITPFVDVYIDPNVEYKIVENQ